MKTKVYNPSEEIKTLILLLVLSFTFFLSAKTQDLPLKNSLSSFTSNINDNTNISVDADFNEKAATSQLAEEIKTWMSYGSYWEPVNEPEEGSLKQLLSSYMSKGLYWSDDENHETVKQEFNTHPIAEAENE